MGHQAVRSSFEVYNIIASIDRLQTSKYIALLTSMFTASFSAFKSSCNLFLCCYRATGSTILPPPGCILSDWGVPPNPFKIPRFVDTLFIDFWYQNDSQNEPKITIKPSFNPDRNPTLFFSHSGTPNGAHKPWKQQYYWSKTNISTNPPFAFWSSFWHQKVSQNMPKTILKPLNKKSRKHIQARHQSW